MKNNKNRKKSNLIIVSVVMLTACGFIAQVFGIANPAAVYCEKLGYQLIIQEEEDGQRGFCQFPDGSAVDEWKFFIGEEGEEYSYCQKQGLEMKTITGEQCQYASKCAVCILKNGTEAKVVELMGLNLESTISPWDPVEPTSNATTAPEHKTNYLFYFIGLIVLLVIAFVVYKKIKNRDNFYE